MVERRRIDCAKVRLKPDGMLGYGDSPASRPDGRKGRRSPIVLKYRTGEDRQRWPHDRSAWPPCWLVEIRAVTRNALCSTATG
jgi:hypothetical protein